MKTSEWAAAIYLHETYKDAKVTTESAETAQENYKFTSQSVLSFLSA